MPHPRYPILLTPDLTLVRNILARDIPWTIYLLGDLEPSRVDACEWRVSKSERSVLLIFRGFETPILAAAGSPAEVDGLLREGPLPERAFVHFPLLCGDLLPSHFATVKTYRMHRMVLQRDAPAFPEGPRILTLDDLADIQELYRDGEPTGENPPFFYPEMVAEGVFCGQYLGNRLTSVAGTHMVIPEHHAAPVGCVYTHRAHRNQGLAAKVTSAVVATLSQRGYRTICLNVTVPNVGARRIYERLGFVHYCDFTEGFVSTASST